MKKINANKKGFTIVELVIVIAVIGILAAILIPTLINLNNKAKVSNTTSFLKNINTQLAMKEANHDIDDFDADYDAKGRFATNTDAKEYAKQKLGYDFDLISPFDGNEICWDKNNKKFGLIDYSDEANPVEVYADVKVEEHEWQRLSNDPQQTKTIITNGDPLTLKDNFSKEELTSLGSEYYDPATETLKVSGTIELGNNPNVKGIEYNNTGAAQEVVIRTNGGTLTVDAENDTVQHYGEAQIVTLTAVGDHSYYEHGSVNLVDVKKGRLVITNDAEAEVGTIYLTATNDAYENIILATQSGSTLPEVVARESVSIPTTGEKLVVTIQTNVDANGENPTKTEEIKLYPASDVKEATNGYNVSDLGLLVVEAISSEAQTQAAEQIKNEEILEAVKESNVSTKEKVVAIATVFAGGKGTKDKPYLISNRQQLENISKVNENYVSKYDYACDLYYGNISTLENESLSGNWSACVDYVYGDNNNYSKAAKANNWSTEVTGGYFKVADGVKEIDCSDWTSGILYGHFDGNGVVLNNLNAALFNTVYDFESNIVPFEVSTISNLTANVNIRSTSRYFEGFITNLGWSTSFKNVVLHGYIEAQNAASFVGLGTGYSGSGAGDAIVISFDNCYSDISLVSVSGYSSGFVAHPYWGQGSKMVINDSIYYGRATSTSGNHYYKGNSSNDGTTSLEETYTDGFFSKYGYASIENLRGTSKTLSANYAVSNKSAILTVKNDLAKPELGSVFTVNQANGAVKAVAKFVVGPNDVNEKGNYTGVFLIDENLTVSNGQFITENVKYYTVTVNGDSTEETGVSGTNFNIVRGSYGTTYTTYMVEIVQYDTDGNIICINRCDLR